MGGNYDSFGEPMITLHMTDTPKMAQPTDTILAVDAAPDAAAGFAALMAIDEPATARAPVTTPEFALDAFGQPIDVPQEGDTQAVELAMLPASPPERRQIARPEGGESARAKVTLPPQSADGPDKAANVPLTWQDTDVPKLGQAEAKAADVAVPRGISTAQHAVEGQSRQGETPTRPQQLKPENAPAAIPPKRDTITETARVEPRQTAPAAQAALPQAQVAHGQTMREEPAAKLLDRSEGNEKRKQIEARTPAIVVPAAPQQSPPTMGVLPSQASSTAQAAVLAAHERDAKDGKALDRDLAIGAASPDRPVSATGATLQAAAASGGEMARTVAQQLSVAVAPGTGKTTEIALNPEELGRVRLTLSAGEGTLTLNVMAERPETQELLRRNIEMLAQEFRALGYQDLSFSFSGDGQAEHGQTPREDDNAITAPMSKNEQTAPQAGLHMKPGLDLRL
jgi:flagellar hook-length control protein FliK